MVDNRDGNREIYFKRSANYGSSWELDTRISYNSAHSTNPSVAAYGAWVFVVWQDNRTGSWNIYLKRSINYGVSWYGEVRLTSYISPYSAQNPMVAACNGNVHVVWQSNENGNLEIYYRRGTQYGDIWDSPRRLTVDSHSSEMPCIAAFGDYVYVAWQDNRQGNYDIFTKRSENKGVAWGVDMQLTTNTAQQYYPFIAAYGYDVYIAWIDYRYYSSSTLNSEVYYRRSINNGQSFGAETRLTNYSGESVSVSLAVQGRTVYAVWQDYRGGKWKIYWKLSPDRGVHWIPDRMLSPFLTSAVSAYPSVSVSGSRAYLVWTDNVGGNMAVYFRFRR